MKAPLIILNKRNYQRRLLNLNEELLAIAQAEEAAILKLRDELMEDNPNTFTKQQFWDYQMKRLQVKEHADRCRKSAYWWFNWFPTVFNTSVLAIAFVIGWFTYKLLILS